MPSVVGIYRSLLVGTFIIFKGCTLRVSLKSFGKVQDWLVFVFFIFLLENIFIVAMKEEVPVSLIIEEGQYEECIPSTMEGYLKQISDMKGNGKTVNDSIGHSLSHNKRER